MDRDLIRIGRNTFIRAQATWLGMQHGKGWSPEHTCCQLDAGV